MTKAEQTIKATEMKFPTVEGVGTFPLAFVSQVSLKVDKPGPAWSVSADLMVLATLTGCSGLGPCSPAGMRCPTFLLLPRLLMCLRSLQQALHTAPQRPAQGLCQAISLPAQHVPGLQHTHLILTGHPQGLAALRPRDSQCTELASTPAAIPSTACAVGTT